jgi:hypothetical protein
MMEEKTEECGWRVFEFEDGRFEVCGGCVFGLVV